MRFIQKKRSCISKSVTRQLISNEIQEFHRLRVKTSDSFLFGQISIKAIELLSTALRGGYLLSGFRHWEPVRNNQNRAFKIVRKLCSHISCSGNKFFTSKQALKDQSTSIIMAFLQLMLTFAKKKPLPDDE